MQIVKSFIYALTVKDMKINVRLAHYGIKKSIFVTGNPKSYAPLHRRFKGESTKLTNVSR